MDAALSDAGQIADLLALDVDDDFTDLQLAMRVSRGLPVASVAFVEDAFGKKAVTDIVPEATYRRAKSKSQPLSAKHSNTIYGLSRTMTALRRVYHGDRESMRRYMATPHLMLDGQTPFDVAISGPAGADLVVKLIEQAEAGVAV